MGRGQSFYSSFVNFHFELWRTFTLSPSQSFTNVRVCKGCCVSDLLCVIAPPRCWSQTLFQSRFLEWLREVCIQTKVDSFHGFYLCNVSCATGCQHNPTADSWRAPPALLQIHLWRLWPKSWIWTSSVHNSCLQKDSGLSTCCSSDFRRWPWRWGCC